MSIYTLVALAILDMSFITLYWGALVYTCVQFGMSVNHIYMDIHLSRAHKEEVIGVVLLHQLFLAVAIWCTRDRFVQNPPEHVPVAITSTIAIVALLCVLRVARITPRIQRYIRTITQDARAAQDPAPT